MKTAGRTYRFRFTLAARLMLYFVVFGIAIGYLTFFFTSFINPIMMVQRASKHIIGRMEETAGASFGLVLEDMLTNPESRRDVDTYLGPLVNERDLLKTAAFYVYNPEAASWNGIDLLERGASGYYLPNPGIVRHLEDITGNEREHDSRPILKERDEITFLIDMTTEGDPKRYALGLTFFRKAFRTYIEENRTQFILFDIFVGLFSIILAKIFSKRITKPISRLSRKADRIAHGDLTQRFKIRRRDEIGSLAHSLNTMADEIEKRLEDTEKQLATMQTMNKIDKAVLSSTSRGDLLDRVMGFISGQFEHSRTILALRNEERGGFEITAFTPGTTKGILQSVPFLPDSSFSEDLRRRTAGAFQTSDPKDEIIRIYKDMTGHFNSVKTLLNVPIFQGGVHAGSIIMTRPGKAPYGDDEVSFVRMLSDQVGVALQSVREVENREALNLGILKALTKAIDAKSPWTAGHSERVARYAEDIGSALNINEEDLRELTISALLHDIGKIAVAESILNKPDKLTDTEFAAIKEHPRRGSDMLVDIPRYAHVLEGVEFHHERWDGSGYPDGKARDDIPFFARIIAVADVYDAITYDRPYRTGMSKPEARDFMQRGKETMFDADMVDVFLGILDSEAKNE